MGVITITGDNDWARQRELHRLTEAFVAEHSALALERIDGEEAEFDRIQEALTSLPFLANKKMVLLTRPSASKSFAEHAERLLAELPETTELVLAEPKFDKRSALYKLLKKRTDFRDFTALEGPALARWLVAAAAEQGATLSAADARYLIERVGANQQMLASEIVKLSLYQPAISRQTIDLLTDPQPQSSMFDLIDAAFAGNRQRALQLYDEQRRLKVEPIQIVAMLAWQLHVLALAVTAAGRSADQIARDAKISPFVAGKALRLARHSSAARVRRLVDQLLTLDQRSKRQSIDLDEALKRYVLELAA